MVDVSRILEIKKHGVNIATAEDIRTFFKIIAEYLNTDARESINGLNTSIAFDIEGVASSLLINDRRAEFKPEKISDPNVQLFSDLKTMAAISSGLLNAQKAFLSGYLEIDGDFAKVIAFLEILETAFVKLGITPEEDIDLSVDAATMKKLYNIYEEGANDVDPENIPLFFDVFCNFINLNEEAINIVEDEDLRVQMLIRDIGPYLICKDEDDNKVKWMAKKVDDAILEFEVSIKTAADVLLGGDATSAYLSGEVTATGNIAQALILQELLELFLELLPFTN